MSPRQVQRVGARYVAIADAVAIARIAALFQERGRPYQIREHNLTSFADLRASPAVLIGMFSNAWTLQLGSGFRFVPTIEGDGHHVGIIDRQRSRTLVAAAPAVALAERVARLRARFAGRRSGHGDPGGHGRAGSRRSGPRPPASS